MTQTEPDPTEPKQPDKSLGDLLGDLTEEFSGLVRTQIDLARTELKREADKAKVAGGAFGAAGLAALMALLLLSLAAAWGLTEVVPEGLAFLLIGLVYAIAAAALFVWARNRVKDINLMPRDTVGDLKEDVQWARQKLS